MGKNGLTAYPYEYMLKYTHLPVNCIWDDKLEMFYIVHYGKKLYYPPGWRKKYIKENYLSLLIEQDIQSAHRYLENYERLRGKTILDIGAAEGMFSLDVIDIVNHVYLFECDTNWTKALNATFAAWKNKVTIVPKYVGNKNDEVNITIDRFLEGKDRSNLFLKMDNEGYEQIALDGAANTLKEAKDLDFSICTYHKKEDAVEIKRRLESCRFETEQTDGFLFYENDFRKAIIRRKI
jgi:hypothetical protein